MFKFEKGILSCPDIGYQYRLTKPISNILEEDLNTICSLVPYKNLLKEYFEGKLKTEELVNKVYDFSGKLYQCRTNGNLKRFCDSSKRTSRSVFFEPHEIQEVLHLISCFKLLAPIIYRDGCSSYECRKILETLSPMFEVSQKLYRVVSYRSFRATSLDGTFLKFIRYLLSYDYLVLYNYNFVMNVVICSYDWTTNPISYIVSVASDNMNYLIMSLNASQPPTEEDEYVVYENEDIVDMAHKSILEEIKSDILSSYMQDLSLYPTPITDCVVVPLLSSITDTPANYFHSLKPCDKLAYQVVLYHLLKNCVVEDTNFKLKDVLPVFLYGSKESMKPMYQLSPSSLEVLKHDFTYYGMENKSIVLTTVNSVTATFSKRQSLKQIITPRNKGLLPTCKFTSQDLVNFVRFLIYIISDDTRQRFNEIVKLQFYQLLRKTRVITII